MKKYRFFFHYYRQYKTGSVHFRGKCMVGKIVCEAPCESHERKTQPYWVMRGYASDVVEENGFLVIKN